ncbi:hypothetical protein TGME49_253035 [Toxoplasma gondii ME49]|uniref:Uncharacterized protein n=2 Tax=Toxoplasma gondii TaxID=5811 RepID=S8FAQ2_TOXGM|nr:hypothetical protein TGME49_253035 [Toxoplasma gondii ME49]EPT31842.1 hypothetical protein TGME49_253035 [Toxoplasma gondii ME49]KYF41840.1 hypothetical protein TGARI_253035 [Toxoplasma gondii ARI]|eukprot:XP_018638196.1 hypothetical protein TGME49_253035 [Toxoplasma gondii ME49]
MRKPRRAKAKESQRLRKQRKPEEKQPRRREGWKCGRERERRDAARDDGRKTQRSGEVGRQTKQNSTLRGVLVAGKQRGGA